MFRLFESIHPDRYPFCLASSMTWRLCFGPISCIAACGRMSPIGGFVSFSANGLVCLRGGRYAAARNGFVMLLQRPVIHRPPVWSSVSLSYLGCKLHRIAAALLYFLNFVGTATTSFPMSQIPNQAVVLLVVVGAGFAVLCAYAIFRFWIDPNAHGIRDMSNEQQAYMREVRLRNKGLNYFESDVVNHGKRRAESSMET
jgi:hypothetical protein